MSKATLGAGAPHVKEESVDLDRELKLAKIRWYNAQAMLTELKVDQIKIKAAKPSRDEVTIRAERMLTQTTVVEHIAREIGVCSKTLRRNKRFMAARKRMIEMNKGELIHGMKSADGTVEAWDDDSDDDEA